MGDRLVATKRVRSRSRGERAHTRSRVRAGSIRVGRLFESYQRRGSAFRRTVDRRRAIVTTHKRFRIARRTDMNDAAQAVMAVSFFGAVAASIRAIASVWTKRLEVRNPALQRSLELDARLERLEYAIDAIAIEVERIGESHRAMIGESTELRHPPVRVGGHAERKQ